MSIRYKMVQNTIKGNKSYGKWYAHAMKQGELTMEEIEQQIEKRCSLTIADVRAAVAALKAVVEQGLKDGLVVDLDELGRFHLSIRSLCVSDPRDFRVDRHVQDIVCRYTPAGHRSKTRSGRIVRPFTNDVWLEETAYRDPETGSIIQTRHGGRWGRS